MKDYNWKKLILVVLGCSILGGFVGYLATLAINNNAPAYLAIMESKFHYMYPLSSAVGIISLILCGYFYLSLKKEGFSNDESSFYERNENKIAVATSMATICGILNFTAMGLTFHSEKASVFWILFNCGLCLISEVSYIALTKKIRPELNADPLNTGFKSNLFDQMDECEKYKCGKASFDTMAAMNIVFVSVFCLCFLTSLIFEISPLICVPVGIIWLAQIILYTVYSIKTSKK